MLVGEPGIGKSRLAREVASWATDRGVPVATGRAVPASGSTAYRPITEALLQLFRHRPLPDESDLDPWIPLLQPVLPALVDRSLTVEVPASLRGEAVLRLVSRMIPAGLVVILEDLHWADPDTVALVEYLADNLSGTSLLLVLTFRDSPDTTVLDVARRKRGRPGVTYLGLERLGQEQSAAMVRACRPDAADEVVQRIGETADGIPLLVEDLLASPGLPTDFAATVKTRVWALPPEQREVIQAAAVLGRQFDWDLLPAVVGQTTEAVSDALAAGLESLLLSSHGAELRFRHALTRDAVIDMLLPPHQRRLAASALARLTSAHPVLDGGRREVAADLAIRAGDRQRAGALLAESGRQSLAWGALATAVTVLRRSADLLAGTPEQADAELDLIEALALAGRVEEAAAAGGRLISRLGLDPSAKEVRLEAHLRLAHAAVAASRWQMARHHLDEARRLIGTASAPAQYTGLSVLAADVAMAADDYGTARAIAEEVLGTEGARPDVRCHAFEIMGRSHRSHDLPAARAAFENALVTAEASNLPHWRLRALHELGTVDMFDHAGVDRLLQARRAADENGAQGTAAVLDLQLAAAFTCRWNLEACDAHANSALAIADRLGLGQVRSKALAMLTGAAGMRADIRSTERYAASTLAAAPEDRMLEGFCWGMRGMALLLSGDEEPALELWARGMSILAKLPHAEPAALRALWPLVLAARADRRAQAAIDEARRLGVATFHLNRAMISYAEAILVGRRGDTRRARELLTLADTCWTNCEPWADLARVLAAPAAAADGWADVSRWLTGCDQRFAASGLPALSHRCQEVLAAAGDNPWSAAGITTREADVLRLVAEGLANKEVAARLHISPRTIEKHVESLLRKSGARSRTELVTRLLSDLKPGAGTT
jgi:DNA-binding CsgD family transcriptional regulator